MPCLGAEMGNEVGSDAGGGAPLAYTAEEASDGAADRGVYVDREVGGDFCQPFDVAGGGEVGNGVWEELEFHGDAIKELGFVLIKLGEDGMAMLECIFDGGEVTVGNVCALAARSICNDVVVKEASFFKNGSEFGGDGSVNEGI